MKSLKAVFLFLLLASFLSPLSAFAQGRSQKMRSASAGERDQDQPQKRAQWNMRGRIAPKGESAAVLRLRAYEQKMAMRAQRAAEAQRAGALAPPPTTWVSRGPSPLASDATGTGFQDYNWVSGRATSVLVDPADATGNTVLLGGAYGGLWKSTNAGSKSATPDLVTWQALIDDQPSLAVGAIALQPGNSNIILVGTGEANSSGDSYYGMGILRSTDGGTTWQQITQDANHTHSFLGVGFSKIAFGTGANANLVVASTAGDIGFDFGLEQDANATARGLYYSTDAGATWNRVTLSDSAVPASASGVVYNSTQGAFYAAIRRHGIYSSTDGQHFMRPATQPTAGLTTANCPVGSNSSTCPIYRAEFAVTPGRNEMYVWIVDVQSGEVDDGIWRTTNGGTAWTHIPDNGITNCGLGGDSSGDGGCGVQQGSYDLELAAVVNSTGTDLYAGAINIYKCHLASGANSCSTIDANVPNDWINLTHVYGCGNTELGALAHVHPDQHGLAFMVASGKVPGYFAHDGGISRTLDGYADLDSGSCTGHNQFDSLAQTLGSMTEFVSFSVHPTSADTMLGGTQDNGSPKTATATSSDTWQNAFGGDGGYNAINPDPGADGVKGDEWFISLPFTEIGICEAGASCNENSPFFYEASPDQVRNVDFGAFYTPFILDPQNGGVMLIGTCRVWRGITTPPPGNFFTISPNFDTGVASFCNGGEVNQVAGLAAGGPQDANGFSNVVYATTWGYGPFAGIGGGQVWVTTNAATTQMSNVTGTTINPNNYAISSVAIDNSDPTGKTAYVGIMGFHTPHVWKTTDAGGTGLASDWADWTGSGGTALPDDPVSALFVDSTAGIIYAGTDVGVFSSPTTGAGGVWTEVGPIAGPGVVGFLPSAPVTAIAMFTAGCGSGELRVSTYGRGIWEFANPDFCAAISNTPQSALENQTVTFNGTLTAFGAYNNPVTLSCGAGAPGACTFSPSSTITPTQAGVAFTVSMSSGNAVQTYNFAIQGTDGTLTHSQSVSLTVNQDFTVPANLTNPPAANAGQSTATSMALSPVGGSTFGGNVTYTCSAGLPTGATCSFSPTQINVGDPATAVTVTVQTAGPFTGAASSTRPRVRSQKQPLWLPLSLPLAGMVLLGFAGRRLPRRYKIVGLCLALALTGFLVACGGGGSTPPPPITVTVTPSPVNTLYPNLAGAPTQSVNLTASVGNSTNQAVTWAITANKTDDSVSSTGTSTATYTAPSSVPPGAVTVTATSQVDATKTGHATINILTPTPPGTYPITATITEGSIQHTTTFNLTVNP